MSLNCHILVENEHSLSLLLVLTSENSALEDEVTPPLVLPPVVGNLHVVPVLRKEV